MQTRCVIFPFDLFGSPGSAAGAQLLGDSLREMKHDTELEDQPVRQHAFASNIDFLENELDTIEALADWRTIGRREFEEFYDDRDFMIWLSGNHLGCLPVYESLERDTLVIQFDAHLDCYDLHDTHTTLSHGNFLKELKGGPAIVNVGHRDLFLPPKAVKAHFTEAFAADEEESKVIAALQKRTAKAKHVWIDLDVDVFDPSVCPAVSTPSPCGLYGLQMLRLLNAVGFEKMRGVSVSEFVPALDVKNSSLDLLGWLLEWILLKKYAA